MFNFWYISAHFFKFKVCYESSSKSLMGLACFCVFFLGGGGYTGVQYVN